VPIRMGGNEAGRFNGERLAVDPNDGSILLFGSRHDGLWKSSSRGARWQRIAGFPTADSEGAPPEAGGGNPGPRTRLRQQPVGIVCVLFDPASGWPGHPTPKIFAAVSTPGTNLFASVDGGVSWQAVPRQPLGLRPNHAVLASDGMLYLSYGKEAGPNTMTDGAVWKYNPKDGAWTDITPVKPAAKGQRFGYGAVAVDARHPATLMVTTFALWQPHDEVFRSTNGGASWQPLLQDAQWDYSHAPYVKSRTPHWMGDIEINPFDSDQVLFTTGYGIWTCLDATAADAGRRTRWVFLDDGLEETVPLALISPPQGAHLLSGLGDIDGFRHDDLAVSPPETFAGPRFANTEDMAFAALNPQVIVRCGTVRDRRSGTSRGAFSLDGGVTWKAFATEPPNGAGAGAIAVSADGRRVVWTPRRSTPCYADNLGTVWQPCSGLSSGVRVAADPVQSNRFYAYDPRARKLFVSTNGAAAFSATGASFPAIQDFQSDLDGGVDGARLCAAPGRTGDLWLALEGAGLFRSRDGGQTFARIGDVEAAVALGFGRAAAGRDYPALYLAGKIHQLTAVFRSDDEGRTWNRITDEHHQFGMVRRVTGDPRIYGRVYLATNGRGIIYGDVVPAREPASP